MNTIKGEAKFNNFLIILSGGCSSIIVIGRIVEKLHPDKYDVMQRHMQDGNITTNLKVNIYCTLPALSVTNVVTWKFHVDDSA